MSKKFIFNFIFFGICAIAAVLLSKFLPISPLTFTFVFLLLLFLPGFSLAKIFKIDLKNSLDNIALYLVLGIIFSLGLSALGILLHLKITGLLTIYYILLPLLFLSALIFSLLRKDPVEEKPFNLRVILKWENLIYAILLFLAFIIYLTVERKGGILTGGDAIYHVSLMRKAFENYPLSIGGLSYIKGDLEIAYLVPAWHVYLAMIAKLTDLSIFQVWREVASPLVLLTLFAWYWLSRKIFPIGFLAALALLFFCIFNLRDGGATLATLPVPHTLTQYILLPLSVGLALKYIFDKDSKLKLLIITLMLVIVMASVHPQAFVYYVLLMAIFTVFYTVLCAKSDHYKQIIAKSLLLTLGVPALLLPAIIFFELKGDLVSKAFDSFSRVISGRTTYSYGIYAWYAFILTPMVVLFRKHRPMVFILSMMALAPIVYLPVIKNALIPVLGQVFSKRLYGNVTWYFLVWASIWGFLMVLLDQLMEKLSFRKAYYWIVSGLLALLLIFTLFFPAVFNAIYKFNQKYFSNNTISWMIRYDTLILITVTLIVLILLVIMKMKPKIIDLFTFKEINNGLPVFLLTFFFVLVLFWPNFVRYGYLKNFQKKARFLVQPVVAPPAEKYAQNLAGGMKVIDFIKNNIPAKSMFEAKGGFFYLPTQVDMHMWAYRSSAPLLGKRLYQPEYPLKNKLDFLKKNKIDYILITNPKNKVEANFSPYPKSFKKIYKTNNALIYKVQL